MTASSSGPNTLPVGLCGLLSRISRVRGVMAPASRSGSNVHAGGSRGTTRRRAPARAIAAAYES